MTPDEFANRMHRAIVQSVAEKLIEKDAVEIDGAWTVGDDNKTLRFRVNVKETPFITVDMNIDKEPF